MKLFAGTWIKQEIFYIQISSTFHEVYFIAKIKFLQSNVEFATFVIFPKFLLEKQNIVLSRCFKS